MLQTKYHFGVMNFCNECSLNIVRQMMLCNCMVCYQWDILALFVHLGIKRALFSLFVVLWSIFCSEINLHAYFVSHG